ncbi:MAG TPA: P1 family peptidase [Dehalococcoidia bacterium]|nr:P1 family peptidase [Dehalococcoidia bacterium]
MAASGTAERSHASRLLDGIGGIPGLRVGHWTNLDGPTGCTVVLAPDEGAVAAVSQRGGAPGTRETDALRPGNAVARVHAVLLTGGSVFGLAAATGVVRFLEERGVGFETRAGRVPIVPAAVLFDLGLGDAAIRPDEAAGYAACAAAHEGDCSAGSIGAGSGATVAKAAGVERALKGGLASACERLHDGTRVAALIAANALGDIIDVETGKRLAWPRADETGRRPTAIELLRSRGALSAGGFTNTTLVVIATTAALTRSQLQRVAEMGHAGLARAIDPSHTPADGDTVFALAVPTATRRRRPPDLIAIGSLAAHATSRAIARAVVAAQGLAGVPGVAELAGTGDRR